MPIIRAALCDDEPRWLEEEQRLLEAYAGGNGVVIEVHAFQSGEQLLASEGLSPDVVFVDIEISHDESGIDLVHKLSQKWPACQVVYVTNFLRYAPDVYVTEHLWFVLKDSFEDRLPEIMEKLVRQIEDGSCALAIETTDHVLTSLPCTQIVSIERCGRETTISCDGMSSYRISDRIPTLLDRLPQRLFVRCHGSFIVNLNHVRLVKRDTIVMHDGTEVPLSRRYVRSFRERYLDWVDDHAL